MHKLFLIIIVSLLPLNAAFAATGLPAITVGGANGDSQTYTVTIEILAMMTALTLLQL